MEMPLLELRIPQKSGLHPHRIISFNIFIRQKSKRCLGHSVHTKFNRANRFHHGFFKVMPIAITSPVAFICVPRVFFAYTNLSKGHLGNFYNYIVQSRFKTSICLPCNLIDNLIQCISDSNFSRYFSNRITGCFEASAEERLTLGFTSITAYSKLVGFNQTDSYIHLRLSALV